MPGVVEDLEGVSPVNVEDLREFLDEMAKAILEIVKDTEERSVKVCWCCRGSQNARCR